MTINEGIKSFKVRPQILFQIFNEHDKFLKEIQLLRPWIPLKELNKDVNIKLYTIIYDDDGRIWDYEPYTGGIFFE